MKFISKEMKFSKTEFKPIMELTIGFDMETVNELKLIDKNELYYILGERLYQIITENSQNE